MRLTDLTPADMNKIRSQAKSLRAYTPATDAQLTAKAEEFESVFLGQMLTHMFAGVETDENFGGGHGEDVYRSFMTDEYAKIITRTGGIGVAAHVKAELLRLQEMGSGQLGMASSPAAMQPQSQYVKPTLQNVVG